LPFAPLLAAGVVLLAASNFGSLGESFAASATLMTCSVLGAALATPALVVSIRYLLVRPVEGLLGIPGRLGLDYVERTLGRTRAAALRDRRAARSRRGPASGADQPQASA
jgi:hypothetical protein